jgi:hypothetical protein
VFLGAAWEDHMGMVEAQVRAAALVPWRTQAPSTARAKRARKEA